MVNPCNLITFTFSKTQHQLDPGPVWCCITKLLNMYPSDSLTAVKPQFKLKSPHLDRKTSIQLVVYCKGRRYMTGIGRSIHPKLWRSDLQRPVTALHKRKIDGQSVSAYVKAHDPKNYHILMEYLRSLSYLLERIEQETALFFTTHPDIYGITPNEFREWFKGKFKNRRTDQVEAVPERELVLPYFKEYIYKREARQVVLDSGRPYSEGTLSSYRGSLKALTDYKGSEALAFDDMSKSFYEHYKAYLVGRFSINTAGKHIKNLRAVLRDAHEHERTSNTAFTFFKPPREAVQSIYLTTRELTQLETVSLTGRDDLVRDTFLLGCYTSQRVSDYIRITSDMIRRLENGTEIIELEQVKTRSVVAIPVTDKIRALLDKYGGELPLLSRTVGSSEVMLNREIKLVAAKAGIKRSADIVSHTARRTGITHLALQGKTLPQIASISGHKKFKTLKDYIKASGPEFHGHFNNQG